MTTVYLSELLKGTSLIRGGSGVVIQSVGNMTVLFLTCESQFSHDDRFDNPMKIVADNPGGYGTMDLTNNGSKDVVVTPQLYTKKSGAQNHALPKSAVVPAGQTIRYRDAGCVEGSQGGTFRDADKSLVPVAMREFLLNEVGHTGDYSHLYPAVSALGTRTGIGRTNYLTHFFDRHGTTLKEFIAHFELPDRTIGTIVLIDGEIIAVDKFPSFRYARQIWQYLIRDCYGSLAIESQYKAQQEGREVPKPVTFEQVCDNLPMGEGESAVEYLQRALTETHRVREEEVRDRLDELLRVEFDKEPERDTTVAQYEGYILKSEGYIGQVISEKGTDFHHAVSLVKKERFNPERLRDTMQARLEYRRLAQEQVAFSL